MKIKISVSDLVFYASLYDTFTGEVIYSTLPFIGHVSTWGDEIYFEAPVQCDLEKSARAEVEIGDLAYWPSMPAFCVFFGPTPVSTGTKPVAAGPVNVFGKLENFKIEELKQIKSGALIKIEKVIS